MSEAETSIKPFSNILFACIYANDEWKREVEVFKEEKDRVHILERLWWGRLMNTIEDISPQSPFSAYLLHVHEQIDWEHIYEMMQRRQ